jgi:hypothetical protein
MGKRRLFTLWNGWGVCIVGRPRHWRLGKGFKNELAQAVQVGPLCFFRIGRQGASDGE